MLNQDQQVQAVDLTAPVMTPNQSFSQVNPDTPPRHDVTHPGDAMGMETVAIATAEITRGAQMARDAIGDLSSVDSSSDSVMHGRAPARPIAQVPLMLALAKALGQDPNASEHGDLSTSVESSVKSASSALKIV